MFRAASRNHAPVWYDPSFVQHAKGIWKLEDPVKSKKEVAEITRTFVCRDDPWSSYFRVNFIEEQEFNLGVDLNARPCAVESTDESGISSEL
jgi:hypothetical protein